MNKVSISITHTCGHVAEHWTREDVRLHKRWKEEVRECPACRAKVQAQREEEARVKSKAQREREKQVRDAWKKKLRDEDEAALRAKATRLSTEFQEAQRNNIAALPVGTTIHMVRDTDGTWRGVINYGRTNEQRAVVSKPLGLVCALAERLVESGGILPLTASLDAPEKIF